LKKKEASGIFKEKGILADSSQPRGIAASMKKKNTSQIITLVIMITAAVAIFLFLRMKEDISPRGSMPGVGLNDPAPDFSLPLIDGSIMRLSQYRGQVVLLNIWATWCPPCLSEMPSMEKLYQTFKDEDFQILAVSIDAAGRKAVEPFVRNHRLSFPVLIDSEGSINKSYRTTGVPESFIVNKKGLIVKKIIGPLDWTEASVLAYFRELLEEPHE
jgi:peroxiredoxin